MQTSWISRGARARTGAGLLCAAAALSGCGTSGGPASDMPPPSPVSSAQAAQAGQQLLGELLPVPPGAQPWSRNPTGLLDQLTVVHNYFGQQDWDRVNAETTRRGFVAAARHGWSNPDGSASDVLLIEFATRGGANSMAQSMSEGWKLAEDGTQDEDQEVHGTEFTEARPGPDGLTASEVVAIHGSVLVYVAFLADGKPDRTAAEKLIKDQVDTLGGV
ncbi:hypothetical protein [Kitasatospora viridis]|uniref:Uncharacterized protein n=1 Tax=Kitasatospora viridis TaxID=281105 RepID=A0A561ULX3_9ACTN|nr:hypothetical protein [Kitasatospora viridis]TWG00371.1 hypothetical protein FHX73_114246 [Kitasatospora viridis]